MLNNFTDKHFHLNLCETIKWKITTFIPISFIFFSDQRKLDLKMFYILLCEFENSCAESAILIISRKFFQLILWKIVKCIPI